jgi:alpha-amylase/alpha-mannosidase (GH57 family)
LSHPRFLCIHGHFYQPPRENPWIEEIEVEDSAAPFHDWNARIAAECYGPNAAARLLVADRRIAEVVNNYRSISFNFGPTLLSWLQRAAPDVYAAVLEADRDSATARKGHGNGLAQAYNHVILPLATRRDKVTQVRWGLVDFLLRYGRRAEGLWLPETAVDIETLEVLAAQGVKFTVLSPFQATAVRAPGHAAWEDARGGRIDPTRPYLIRLPSGGSIAAFFYDGPIAKALAFEGGLNSADEFVRRLEGGYSDARPHAELLHVAVDGETFGHHRKGGEEVLAAALREAERRGWKLTNYGEYLEHHPPEWEAQIAEGTAWSCAHGVDRWRADCGCNTGGQPGWNQAWRKPLRHALDTLRDHLADLFEREGGRLFADPWAARDRFIEVVLDREPARVQAWLAEQEASPGLLAAEENRVQALRLLELQRHAMLMYTSCGWFFSEVSGIETVQVLKYAARAIQLARDAGGPALEPIFLAELKGARSNLPVLGDGAQVYERFVRPSIASLDGIVAHHGIARLFDEAPRRRSKLFCYRLDQQSYRREAAGPSTLSVGRVKVTSEITHETADTNYAVLHFGGNDFRCSVRPFADPGTYAHLEDELFQKFSRFSLTDVVRAMDTRFAGQDFRLRDLFVDERRAVANRILRETLSRYERDYQRIFDESRRLMRFLQETNIPVPTALRAAADLTLSNELGQTLADLRDGASNVGNAHAESLRILAEARGLAVRLEVEPARREVERLIVDRMRTLAETPRRDLAREIIELVELGEALNAGLNLWEAQNLYWARFVEGDLVSGHADRDVFLRLGERLFFDRRSLEARARAAHGEARLPALG